MPKRKTDEETAMKENKERESNILRVMYVIFCVTCIWIAARIVYLQCNFIDSDPYLKFSAQRAGKWWRNLLEGPYCHLTEDCWPYPYLCTRFIWTAPSGKRNFPPETNTGS